MSRLCQEIPLANKKTLKGLKPSGSVVLIIHLKTDITLCTRHYKPVLVKKDARTIPQPGEQTVYPGDGCTWRETFNRYGSFSR